MTYRCGAGVLVALWRVEYTLNAGSANVLMSNHGTVMRSSAYVAYGFPRFLRSIE